MAPLKMEQRTGEWELGLGKVAQDVGCDAAARFERLHTR